jgi:hypothetical protein
MKKVAGLMLFALALASCGYYGPFTEEWTITGTLSCAAETTSTIRMAAFFTIADSYGEGLNDTNAFDPVLVSNVIEVTSTGDAFSLAVDSSACDPQTGDLIELIIWEDDNDDGLHSSNEEYWYVRSAEDCPVFQGDGYCGWYFEQYGDSYNGRLRGWNQTVAYGYEPIDSAVKDGAILDAN